jgi:hypothetical protein
VVEKEFLKKNKNAKARLFEKQNAHIFFEKQNTC